MGSENQNKSSAEVLFPGFVQELFQILLKFRAKRTPAHKESSCTKDSEAAGYYRDLGTPKGMQNQYFVPWYLNTFESKHFPLGTSEK